METKNKLFVVVMIAGVILILVGSLITLPSFDGTPKHDEVMGEIRSFNKMRDDIVINDDIQNRSWGSLPFINKKLDELKATDEYKDYLAWESSPEVFPKIMLKAALAIIGICAIVGPVLIKLLSLGKVN